MWFQGLAAGSGVRERAGIGGYLGFEVGLDDGPHVLRSHERQEKSSTNPPMFIEQLG